MNQLQEQVSLHRAAQCLLNNNVGDARLICEGILAKNKKNVHALSLLGQAEMQSGEIDSGLALFRKAAALQPKSLDSQLNLAQALARAGQNREAIKTFQKALRTSPGNAEAIQGMATAYERSGDDAAAEQLLKPIIDAGRFNLRSSVA